jgi:alpha-amylase/alpha-mannosidase (GH57 family)
MTHRRLVIHGHFYQPPRENPWTEAVPVEPSAAPAHDWNERITEESYRPNAVARILDDRGAVVALVDNYRLMSFNVGPTLLSWLEVHHADVYAAMVRAGRDGRGAIAQGYSHMILALATHRDITTQVRWGLADFAHRFGRRAEGMWLPETGVNDEVLSVLAEEGVGFTILAPGQATRVRPLGGGDDAWVSVDDGSIDGRRTYRWRDPNDQDRGVTVVFYDGSLSQEVAFGLGTLTSAGLVERAEHLLEGSDEPVAVVCVATDGETFGHHHRWGERAVAYALAVEAPARGIATGGLADLALDSPPAWEVEVKESAWSCVHGVGRWKEDCGCHTGGGSGWQQRWRGPLRAAFDRIRDHGVEVFERRGSVVLSDPWAARDAYVDVVLGAVSIEDFAARWVRGESGDAVVEALTLLEAQRHAMLMYTSCGWFFNDIAGLETVQVMRYAARAVDLLDELGESPDVPEVLALLDAAVSNDPSEGTGRDIWRHQVEPTRVGAARVVAHLAMVDLLERSDPPATLGGYEVIVHRHDHGDRGSVEMCSGRVELRHRRTWRRHEYVYAALRMGALEITGALRRTVGDAAADDESIAAFGSAFRDGERVSGLVRRMVDDIAPASEGGEEFGLESALPDAADQVLRSTAQSLADRFDMVFERLVTDASDTFEALTIAGYPLPPDLKVPVQMASARRLEADLVALGRGYSALTYRSARETAEQARAQGLSLTTPDVSAALREATLTAVSSAVDERHLTAVEAAIALVRLALLIDHQFDLSRAQDLVYFALVDGTAETVGMLRPLGVVLGLAVDTLGIPRVVAQ